MTRLPDPTARPAGLHDQFGRRARDLRVSVTDRCNLRCTYCMPAEGLDWLPKPEMLTDDELVRVVGVMVGLGVTSVRFTGGEPPSGFAGGARFSIQELQGTCRAQSTRRRDGVRGGK